MGGIDSNDIGRRTSDTMSKPDPDKNGEAQYAPPMSCCEYRDGDGDTR